VGPGNRECAFAAIASGPGCRLQPKRLRVGGLIAAALLAVVGVAWSGAAEAQAPGPMSKGHEHLDGPLDCQRCHEGGSGVPDAKCLGCHDHRELRLRIEAGKGFHADPEVKRQACKDCHGEHLESRPGSGKGKPTTVDWRPFGGKRNFPHQRAGWPLEGAHRYQKCEKCHERKSAKTGQTIFLGLRSECTTCHKNPHRFDDIKLNDCTICHTYKNRQVANLGATKFDHDKTRFPLVGHHLRKKCVKCHETTETFEIAGREVGDCKGCHQDSHRSVISAGRRCDSCHDAKQKFQLTKFDHAANTKFPLRGKHAKADCKACHKVGTSDKPVARCVSCHEDVHRGRFGDEGCEGCHVETGWPEMVYAHGTKARFALNGAHAATTAADCLKCHRRQEPKNFEKLASSACADCHRHEDAHCGQFGRENCERCHVRGGDRTSRFDHDITGFRLIDGHAKPSCDGCHKPAVLGDSPACKEAVKYTGLDANCGACHEDIHKGELGAKCTNCHTGGRDFKVLVFDHNRDSRFALTGFHQVVACDGCHPKRRYKLGDPSCEACHGKDDAHEAALGQDCAKCHETTGGAPKFDHDVHTDFLLEGVHRRVECARCHFVPAPGTPEREALGKQGHAAVAPPGAAIDLVFRVGGQRCVDCHPDPHGVRPALDCDRCHGAEAWTDPPRNGYHERAGFSLTGAHTVLRCDLCHVGGGSLRGRGEQCGTCHVRDDVHAGSFGNDCGRCHEQSVWLPTQFNHMSVGFVLEGVHRTLDCRGCHQAGNYFIGDRCWSCHLKDYREAVWHQQFEIFAQKDQPKTYVGDWLGTPGAFRSLDCDQCHNQFSFAVGTYGTPEVDR
jgi:hypothetical protein